MRHLKSSDGHSFGATTKKGQFYILLFLLIDEGYYTVARRYEFYVGVAILFLPRELKIHVFGLTCNVLFII